jgi:carbamoyl-phosphate synthase small subunit
VNKELLHPILAGPRCARLALSDGAIFRGFAAGASLASDGEVVFNTSMTGYQEMLSDPSYDGQILVLTTPHVGNVGANDDDQESARVWARGLIVPDFNAVPSSWRATGGVLDRAAAHGVPVGWGFDTRALVLHLREHGALPGVLDCTGEGGDDELLARAAVARGTDGCDLTGEVACTEMTTWHAGPWRAPGANGVAVEPIARIAVIDCGVKRSILRRLVGAGAKVTVVPPRTSAGSRARAGRRGLERPGRPARSPRCRRRCASCSAGCRCSASASATNCSAWRSAAPPTSCGSVTTAATTRCATKPPSRSGSPRRITTTRSTRPRCRRAPA